MPSLIEALQAFNRRERQMLVGWALDRLTFPMGHEFREDLSDVLRMRVPADSFVAMDYNLNWLCAALMWAHSLVGEGKPRASDPSDGIELNDNSDCDLIVAFARGPLTHVVLLEAKGYTAWQVKQLNHKAERLKSLFGDEGNRFDHVAPSWVFVSPKEPPSLDWAPWMLNSQTSKPHHLPLPQPASHRFAVVRCDSTGKAKDGGYWKIRADAWPSGPEPP